MDWSYLNLGSPFSFSSNPFIFLAYSWNKIVSENKDFMLVLSSDYRQVKKKASCNAGSCSCLGTWFAAVTSDAPVFLCYLDLPRFRAKPLSC